MTLESIKTPFSTTLGSVFSVVEKAAISSIAQTALCRVIA